MGILEEVLKKINGWTQYSSHKLQDYFPPGVHLKFHFSERKCSWEGKCLENITASSKLQVWDSFTKLDLHFQKQISILSRQLNSFEVLFKMK